jgi:aspartyl aminopeptidase
LKNHYYGASRSTNDGTPLADARGRTPATPRVEFTVGEAENDPVFTVTDLLPHLAKDRCRKNDEAISGEDLNILAGQLPFVDKEVKNGQSDAFRPPAPG